MMYAAPLFALLAGMASAQDVFTARLMQDGKCLAPDSPTFRSPVSFQECNKNPYQWWQVSNSTVHLGNTDFCLSAGRNPRNRCPVEGVPKPGAKFFLIGCPRDGSEFVCESWTFKDGHLQNAQRTDMCAAGGAAPTAQTCSGECDQMWEHS